ncbi:hypothetical protein [Oxalicibacterium faecigallinarum]|uniref:Uncharacterized protein n=1 Tax=Oxalicibacterium faecigallinarum TaxID=573741 RepID=A0A8J3F0J6_9BURK|nr:hypothetical protein [Oxalicibacterium faecigallinarum]GGI16054.1 hypothetical protein GCM10008066_02040 [Oxalicibacterium faecigallinarum]
MEQQQNWSTELYKGLEIHVATLKNSGDGSDHPWDYTIRICEPGVDATAESDLLTAAGDDGDYATAEEAFAAGFKKGYALVDSLKK